MATALTSELTRFTDKCNNVLAGGIVKTFEPNSLTPKTSYQDPECTIPNLPEVNLDETGRARIYIQGDYRIQVYSRDGVLIEDNLLVEQSLVQRDFVELSQEIQVGLQQALDQFEIESNAAVNNLYAAITSIGGMVVGGQFKLDWTHVFNTPTTLAGYGIANAYTKTEVDNAFVKDSERGVPLGVAELNGSGLLYASNLPAATSAAIGAVKLNNTLTSTATDAAATAAQAKVLADRDFGIGQTWQDVKASRNAGTTYTNSTNRPISVYVKCRSTSSGTVNLEASATVGGVEVSSGSAYSANTSYFIALSFIVPPGATYSVTLVANVALDKWSELR